MTQKEFEKLKVGDICCSNNGYAYGARDLPDVRYVVLGKVSVLLDDREIWRFTHGRSIYKMSREELEHHTFNMTNDNLVRVAYQIEQTVFITVIDYRALMTGEKAEMTLLQREETREKRKAERHAKQHDLARRLFDEAKKEAGLL